jgi:uncharacterized protein YyaL (SSP411 family)
MILEAVADAWQQRRDEIREQGARALQSLGATARIRPSDEPLGEELLEGAVAALRRGFDPAGGGFGGAPKFPPASLIEFLLARDEREMSLGTLRAMARGGIYDQVGGGFSRYAVDATWTVPHFEKMLYDNALLARTYLHGWQVSGDRLLQRVCRETLDWALREMRGPEGGFCSALDADSEAVEGKFYVWSLEELSDVVGPSLSAEAIAFFGATERGNFERMNVLEGRGPEPEPERLAQISRKLYEARAARVRPGLDDKRLTAWNALMISALAEAGAALAEAAYVDAAIACGEFVLGSLRDGDGRLLRTWKDGRGRLSAYLEDHALLLQALIALYEATLDPRWYHEATALADVIIARFSDREHGGFFSTADDHERLAVRRKDLEDTPIPSGSSAAALGLLRLARLSGSAAYDEAALGVLRLMHPLARRHPQAFGHLLQAIDFELGPVREVAVVGSPGSGSDELVSVVRSAYRPHVVLAGGSPDGVPLLAGRSPVAGRAAAYVCERFTCQAPVTDAAALAELLGG